MFAGKLKYQEAAEKQDPFSKVITVCVTWRLTCSPSSVGMKHTCLLIFKEKFRNLSTAEIGNTEEISNAEEIGSMENSCAIAFVPLSPSS